MELFTILKNLYMNPKSDWILKVDDNQIKPVIIQRFLALNPLTTKHARFLNKFTYTLPPQMYLSTAWSILFFNGKKLTKPPFTRYPQKTKDEEYDFIINKVKKQYKLSNKDLQVNKEFIKQAIKKDKPRWFTYYGITKGIWAQYDLDVTLMKTLSNKPYIEQKTGLDKW